MFPHVPMFPPLPDSDDEMMIRMENCSSKVWYAYRSGLAKNLQPYIFAEAEAIRDAFALVSFAPLSMSRLVKILRQMERADPSGMFARSLEASVNWHIRGMEKKGIVSLE